MTMKFRVRPSAVIIHDGAILLIDYDEPGTGVFHTLPGGGLEPGEPLADGLRREVREETGVEVSVGPLLLVWERAGGVGGPYHQIGLAFRCDLTGPAQAHKPEPGDTYQTGVSWVPLGDLSMTRLLPVVMAGKLVEALAAPAGIDPFVAGHW